jgi:hypothetical protein
MPTKRQSPLLKRQLHTPGVCLNEHRCQVNLEVTLIRISETREEVGIYGRCERRRGASAPTRLCIVGRESDGVLMHHNAVRQPTEPLSKTTVGLQM